MSQDKTQISPIAPEGYGERFVKFITGITMSMEEAEREKRSNDHIDGSIYTNRQSSHHFSRSSTERVMERAEKEALKTEERGSSEDKTPDRTLTAARNPVAEQTGGVAGSTLPVVEEAGEASSTGGRSARSCEGEGNIQVENQGGLFSSNLYSSPLGGRPPPTPPKDIPPSEKQLPSLPTLMAPPPSLRPSPG